jgi:hypothetical protein
MTSLISRNAIRCLQAALFEYLMIVVPVAMYVAMEAFHHQHWGLMLESPEWAIATIFLSFHGAVLYVEHLKKSGRELSETTLLLLSMAVVVVIAAAVVNAYDDLETVTRHSLLFRVVLFSLASIAFLLMVGGAKLVHTRSMENP